MKLFMAVMACLLGYGEVGLWLKSEASRKNSWVVMDGNPYKPWMDIYSGVRYQEVVKKGLGKSCRQIKVKHGFTKRCTVLIEARAAADSPSEARLQEWLDVWRKCTALEKGFWDMAMNLSW